MLTLSGNCRYVVYKCERIQDLQTEIDAQNAKKIKNKALIEKLEEAKAQNELILMRLEDKEVILH